MKSFEQLLSQFSSQSSLENGNDQFIRYSVYSSEGQRALELYEKGVSLMKERSSVDQGDPFGWVYQAGIHGNFWRNISDLAEWSAAYNYQFTSEEDVLAGNTVLNNCTHYNNQWSNIAISPGTNMELNFVPWHRLLLQSHESIIRQLLSEEDVEGADTFSIPYWDYTNPEEGVIPQAFRDESSALYEFSRGVRVNAGESVEEQGVLPTIQKGLADSMEQTTYAAFNSLLDQNPHGFMHDYLGGSRDSPAQQALTGEAQQAYAEQLGAGDADDIGNMGLMGNVASAALDPVFFTHHSFIDKIWSDWNASENATYIDESLLVNNPWNYVYFTPSEDGSPQLEEYSYWGNNPNEVLSAVYHPNYTYDNDETRESKPNPVLSLIQNSAFRPVVVDKQVDSALQNVQSDTQKIQPISLGLQLSYSDIIELSKERDIDFEINLDYTIPMDRSDPFRVIFLGFETLSDPEQLEKLLEQYDPGELPGFTIVPFPMGGAKSMDDSGTNDKMPMNSDDMMMTTGVSIDLTYALEMSNLPVNDLSDDGPLGMVAISTDSNDDIAIKQLSISLNQNLNPTNSNGSTFDAAAYLAEYPDLLLVPEALEDPFAYFQKFGNDLGHQETNIEDRAEQVGFGYLVANKDLISELNNSPFRAIEHYLNDGLKEGRNLLPSSELIDEELEPIVGPQAFRLFNGLENRYITTASTKEIYDLLKGPSGWGIDGSSFQVGSEGSGQQIYRFIDEQTGSVYYSKNEALDANMKELGFLSDGLAFELFSESSDPSSAVIQYFDPSTGRYLLSSSPDEQQMLEQGSTWVIEGILGYTSSWLEPVTPSTSDQLEISDANGIPSLLVIPLADGEEQLITVAPETFTDSVQPIVEVEGGVANPLPIAISFNLIEASQQPLDLKTPTAGGGTIGSNAPAGINLSIDGIYINSAAGADVITGSQHNDFIRAGANDDVIDAGAGDDLIRGGAGSDIITTGEGFDRIYYTADQLDDTEDTVLDFSTSDRVVLGENILASLVDNVATFSTTIDGVERQATLTFAGSSVVTDAIFIATT